MSGVRSPCQCLVLVMTGLGLSASAAIADGHRESPPPGVTVTWERVDPDDQVPRVVQDPEPAHAGSGVWARRTETSAVLVGVTGSEPAGQGLAARFEIDGARAGEPSITFSGDWIHVHVELSALEPPHHPAGTNLYALDKASLYAGTATEAMVLRGPGVGDVPAEERDPENTETGRREGPESVPEPGPWVRTAGVLASPGRVLRPSTARPLGNDPGDHRFKVQDEPVRELDPVLDPPIQMSIGDVEVVEDDPLPATTDATFQVTLSSASGSDITASWATANGSAIEPGDYTMASGVVTFLAGSTSEIVVVQVVRNTAPEPDRRFYVDLSSPSGAVLLKSRGVGTILDDDATAPAVEGFVVISDHDPVQPTFGRNRLQWRNPLFTGSPFLRIRWNEPGAPCALVDYPTDPDGPSDGVTPDVALVGSHESQIYEHTGLSWDVDYCYTVWVTYPAYSTASQATGRPFDASGPVKWKYFTRTTAIVAPAVGFDAVVAVSNDQYVHAMERGVAGGPWPSVWSPVALGDVAQNRSPVVTSGGVSRVFVTTQDGTVQAIDVKTGAVLWTTLLTPAFAQAAPAGIFAAFGAAWDYILVGTSEGSNANRFYALDPADGKVVDYFPKGVDGVAEMGPILQMASVDYSTGRVYVGVIKPTTYTLLCLQLGPTTDALQLHWGLVDGDVDETDTSPVLRGGRVYTGTKDDKVYSIPEDGNPAGIYSQGVGDQGVKAFVWPDRSSNDLYVATDKKVQGLTDTGAALVDKWPTVDADDASLVLLWPGTNYLYVGSSDVGGGQAGLFEIDVSLADPDASKKALVLEPTSLVIGAPALDIGHDLLILGSEAGTYYAVSVPLP